MAYTTHTQTNAAEINNIFNVTISDDIYHMGNNYVNVVTHSGTFHGDEVVAVAIISMAFPSKMVYVTRTRDKDKLEQAKYDPETIVVDVGGEFNPEYNNYDHHQKTFSIFREDGVIKYSSAGLVWKYYAQYIPDMDDFVYSLMVDDVIKPVDAVDNGVKGFYSPISDIISSYNPNWEDESQNTENRQFLAAVKVAKDYLENKVRFYKGTSKALDIIINSEVIDNKILVLSRFVPWQRHVCSNNCYDNILYVVFPDKSGAWRIQAVPPSPESFDMRKPLPQEWRGLREEELKEVTGIGTAIFCHPAGFIAGCQTKDDAIKLAKLAVAS